MGTTRRNLLRSTAGAAALAWVDVSWLRGLEILAADAPPDKVRFDLEIEPIVQLIEETPRGKCVPVFIDQLRRGLSYRRFLSAAFFACIRWKHCHHDVYKIHAVHHVSQEVRPEERLLPLFWALDGFKQRSEDFPGSFLPPLTASLPSAENAAAEFHDAMRQPDLGRAEPALVALTRSLGARQTIEQLWLYGCRNGKAGGHGAISVANSCRALESIGGRHADSVLRFVIQDLFYLGYVEPDANFAPNTARVDQHLDTLPKVWAGDRGDAAATRELFSVIRAGMADAACDLAIRQLAGNVNAQAIWDAVHLATAELLVRNSSGWGLASRPLHANTSTNALHYAFRVCLSPKTRLLLLLQAVAWAAARTNSELSEQSLREMQILELDGASLPKSADDAVAEIFELLPLRTYRWDPVERKALLNYGERSDADQACRKAFALLKERPEARQLFARTAYSWLCQKASADHHEYKILAAMLEDATLVSAEFQPHLLAAGVHYFHGNHTPDNPVVQQVRDALRNM